jgi:LysM repeat protein
MGIGKPSGDVSPPGLHYNVDMIKRPPVIPSFMIASMFLLFALTACQAASEDISGQTPTATTTLIPFRSATPTPVLATSTPIPPTQPPLPTPTPTYRVHVVKKGEDFGGIAFQYDVTLMDLIAVNPEVDPYIMSVGISLNIPATVEKAGDDNLAPTPVGVQVDQPVCYPSVAQGAWCFSSVFNPFETSVENVSAILRVQVAGQENQQSYEMFPGLNTIPAQGRMPILAYVAEGVGNNPNTSVELTSALPLKADDERYLLVNLENLVIEIASRATASVAGSVALSADAAQAARQIWILAVAYDAQDRIVGVRRYEMNQTLAAGEQRAFSFEVYSAAGSITRVDVRAEAMP